MEYKETIFRAKKARPATCVDVTSRALLPLSSSLECLILEVNLQFDPTRALLMRINLSSTPLEDLRTNTNCRRISLAFYWFPSIFFEASRKPLQHQAFLLSIGVARFSNRRSDFEHGTADSSSQRSSLVSLQRIHLRLSHSMSHSTQHVVTSATASSESKRTEAGKDALFALEVGNGSYFDVSSIASAQCLL